MVGNGAAVCDVTTKESYHHHGLFSTALFFRNLQFSQHSIGNFHFIQLKQLCQATDFDIVVC